MAQYFHEFRDLTSDHKTSILLTAFIPVCLVRPYMVYVSIIAAVSMVHTHHTKADLEMLKALCHVCV